MVSTTSFIWKRKEDVTTSINLKYKGAISSGMGHTFEFERPWEMLRKKNKLNVKCRWRHNLKRQEIWVWSIFLMHRLTPTITMTQMKLWTTLKRSHLFGYRYDNTRRSMGQNMRRKVTGKQKSMRNSRNT